MNIIHPILFSCAKWLHKQVRSLESCGCLRLHKKNTFEKRNKFCCSKNKFLIFFSAWSRTLFFRLLIFHHDIWWDSYINEFFPIFFFCFALPSQTHACIHTNTHKIRLKDEMLKILHNNRIGRKTGKCFSSKSDF